MSSTDVNDFCRLCKQNIRIKGTLSNTKKIYELGVPNNKSVFQRLHALGLTLRPQVNKSFRICTKCFRFIPKIEDSLSTLQKWKLSEETGSEQIDACTQTKEKLEREVIPSKTFGPLNPPTLFNIRQNKISYPPAQNPSQLRATEATTSNMPPRQSVTEVLIHYPSKQTRRICPTSAAGIVENISKGSWTTAANLIMKHDIMPDKIKECVLHLIDNECKRLCNSNQDFMLWRCSPEDLKAFSFAKMESDLQRLGPFLFSLLSTITNQSRLQTCAAASIALRGRNPHLSAFAYYINSVLQYGGAKKAVFTTLSKFGISTSHCNAVRKKQSLANTCGEAFHLLKEKESLPNPQEMRTEDTTVTQQESEGELSNDGTNMEQFVSPGNQKELADAHGEDMEAEGATGTTTLVARDLDKAIMESMMEQVVLAGRRVPSIAPFNEDVLKEAEHGTSKEEEERKLAKQERGQKRKEEQGAGAGDAADLKTKRPRKDEIVKQSVKPLFSTDKTCKKFLCSELNKVIDASDVVVEVLDARDPMGCRCPQLEEAVLGREGNKKLLFLLNKIDLVPKENVERWLQCLQQEFPAVVFKASNQLQDKTVPENGVVDQTKGVTSYGSSCLLQLLGDYAGREGMLKVGVVGFPNVGKSSVVNSLKGIWECNAGFQSGMTKCMQVVHISENVQVIDSPGIVACHSSTPASAALRSLQVEEKQEGVLEAVRTLLIQCDKQQIMLQYNVPDFGNSLEFLTCFAMKSGFLQTDGVPDTEQAATAFLSDWTGAKLSYCCKAPEHPSLPTYLCDSIVARMQQGWDLDELRTGNQETLESVKFPNKASSIGFTSKGPTAGILAETDVPEERCAAAELDEEEMEGNEEPGDSDAECVEVEVTDEIIALQNQITVTNELAKVGIHSVCIDLTSDKADDT